MMVQLSDYFYFIFELLNEIRSVTNYYKKVFSKYTDGRIKRPTRALRVEQVRQVGPIEEHCEHETNFESSTQSAQSKRLHHFLRRSDWIRAVRHRRQGTARC